MNRSNSHVTISVFIVCVSAFVFSQSLAQQSKTDSLLAVLETSKPDTNKVNTLYALANVFYNSSEPVKVLEYAQQGLNLANEIEFINGKSKCLNAIGLAYYEKGIFDTALINFEKRFEIVTEMNDSMGIASVYDNLVPYLLI